LYLKRTSVEVHQVFKVGILTMTERGCRLEVFDVLFRERERIEMLQALIKATKNGEFSLEGIFSKEQLKYGRLIVLSNLPVRVSHRDLIQVRQQRGYQWVGWPILGGF
jgi:hypothetical protein